MKPRLLQPQAEAVLMDLGQEWHARAFEIYSLEPPTEHFNHLQAQALAISDVITEAAGWRRCTRCGDWFHPYKGVVCICDEFNIYHT